MREILFKAKRLDNGEWIEGGLVHQTDYYGIKVDHYFIIDGTGTHDYDIGHEYRVDPDTICQYTGFTDKNGNKIWENDIIKHYNYWSMPEMYSLGKIFFDRRLCRFRRTSNTSNDDVNIGINCIYEVIGNIFDNPEMMEVQE